MTDKTPNFLKVRCIDGDLTLTNWRGIARDGEVEGTVRHSQAMADVLAGRTITQEEMPSFIEALWHFEQTWPRSLLRQVPMNNAESTIIARIEDAVEALIPEGKHVSKILMSPRAMTDYLRLIGSSATTSLMRSPPPMPANPDALQFIQFNGIHFEVVPGQVEDFILVTEAGSDE